MGSAGLALLRLLSLLLALLSPGSTEELNALVGTTVQLKVTYSGKATGYTWTKGNTRVAEWDEPLNVTYYETLKGRCELDTSTGVLNIRDLKEEDSAGYKGEALVDNHYVSSTYDLRVFPSLKNPTVTCNDTGGYYTILCTHRPEPPTYSWHSKDGLREGIDYSLSSSKQTLTLKDAKVPFRSLECVVQNPVSNKSAPLPQDCFKDLINDEGETPRRRYVLITFAVIVFIVIPTVCIGFLAFKRSRKNERTTGGGVDDEEKSLRQRILVFKRTAKKPSSTENDNHIPAEEHNLTQDESACQGPGNNVPQSGSGEGGNDDDPDQRLVPQVSDPKEIEDDGERVINRPSSQNSLCSGVKREEIPEPKV